MIVMMIDLDEKDKQHAVSENQPDSGAETPLTDEQKVRVQELYDQYFKKVPVETITDAVRQQIEEIIALVNSLKAEIQFKRSGALEKKVLMQEKLASLKQAGKFKINENEFEKFYHGVDEYIKLLDTMLQEVDRDLAFYQSYMSPTPPEFITVERAAPDSFEQVLALRFKMVRKNVKNAKHDLAISYSRYSFGFESQMRQILYVESVVQHSH
jgi:hypothetical protein